MPSLDRMAGDRTHYQVLDVSPLATREQVRDQYRKLVRLLHPDRYAGSSEAERRLAERRMREVTEAWSVIGDAAARSRYDDELARADAARRSRARRAAQAASTTSSWSTGASAYASAGRGPGPGGPGPGGAGPGGAGATVGQPGQGATAAGSSASAAGAAFEGLRYDPEPDEVELPVHRAFLLRRGPVLVILAVLLGILIGSAYASSTKDDAPQPARGQECVVTAAGRCQGR